MSPSRSRFPRRAPCRPKASAAAGLVPQIRGERALRVRRGDALASRVVLDLIARDAPEAEDDREGVPFSGEMGQLTDKMFAAIGLTRGADSAEQAIYLTNVLNWRPPGNRTPLAAEIEISLPFLRRHIALIRPKILYLMGGLASKALFGTDETVGKLRGKQHVFTCGDFSCPALVSYHPTFLLKSPLKKREAWDDLQALKGCL